MSEMALFAAATFPEIYEDVLVHPLFRPFAEELVARLQPGRGESLIEMACRTGIAARLVRVKLGIQLGLSVWTATSQPIPGHAPGMPARRGDACDASTDA